MLVLLLALLCAAGPGIDWLGDDVCSLDSHYADDPATPVSPAGFTANIHGDQQLARPAAVLASIPPEFSASGPFARSTAAAPPVSSLQSPRRC